MHGAEEPEQMYEPEEAGHMDGHAGPLTLPQILRIPGAIPVMISFFCYCTVEQTTGLWAGSYLVLRWGVDPEQAAIQYLYRTLDLRDHDKRVVAQIYLSYLTDDDYRHDVHYEEESNRGYRYEGNKARFVFPPMLGLAIERQGEEKVQKEIIRYLQNPDDRRDAYSFFSDLAGWDEEVSRVEAEMAANA